MTALCIWVTAIKHHKSRKKDVNCIKKDPYYMSGNFSCHNSLTCSTKKAKELSKKMGMTLNDLMLGITTKCVKEYFVSQGDQTEEISVSMPFSFATIPEKK